MNPDQAEIKRLAIVPNACKIIIIDSGTHIFFQNLQFLRSQHIYVAIVMILSHFSLIIRYQSLILVLKILKVKVQF